MARTFLTYLGSSLLANIGVGSGATGALEFVDNFTGSFNAATVNFNQGLFDLGMNTLNIGGTGSIKAQTFNLRGTFAIDYQGADGDDITLRVSNIAPASGSGVQASLGGGAATGPAAIIDPAADVVLIGVLPEDPAMYALWGG